jgi:alkane 1-monooxygenase
MKDLKYLAALSIPITVLIAIYARGVWCYLPAFYAFVIIPIMEELLPIDVTNHPDNVQTKRKANSLFDWMLYINIPVVFILLVFALYTVASSALSPYELVGLALSTGMLLSTNGINVAHELGHRKNVIDRFLSKLLLMPSLYMHFYIEHNHSHHLHAATSEDPATAKYNQSLYSFWATSSSGQYLNAWKVQMKLLQQHKKSFFDLSNDLLWTGLIQLGYLSMIYTGLGAKATIFALCTGVVSFLFLETVNYIEHYGLLRLKTKSGRYERVQTIHSWNSNHIVGRIVLYELTRHSDHHYKSSKKYQTLDSHSESPQLPFGYTGSMVLAFIPPLWFYIMNKRIPPEMIVN